MAESKAIFRVHGFKPRNVIDYSYQFTRPVDPENQVSGRARGGKITVTVKARKDGNNELLAWTTGIGNVGKKGEIVVYDYEGKEEKTIQFQDGYGMDYTENWKDVQWDTKDGKLKEMLNHTEKIVISCKIIAVGSSKFKNDWE